MSTHQDSTASNEEDNMPVVLSPQNNPNKLRITVKGRIVDAPTNASHIWEHVEDIIGSEGYCRCKKCPKSSRNCYSLEHGTSSISRHLTEKHSIYTPGSSLLQKQPTLSKSIGRWPRYGCSTRSLWPASTVQTT